MKDQYSGLSTNAQSSDSDSTEAFMFHVNWQERRDILNKLTQSTIERSTLAQLMPLEILGEEEKYTLKPAAPTVRQQPPSAEARCTGCVAQSNLEARIERLGQLAHEAFTRSFDQNFNQHLNAQLIRSQIYKL